MNYYAEAIEALTDPDIDFRRIVIDVAKHHPKIFLEATGRKFDHGWRREVDTLLRAEKKINAIKLWRSETGLGLKEAKDAVEARQREIGLA